MTYARFPIMFLLLAAADAIEAAEWRYSVGVHDFGVPDVDSHTYGINASVSMDERTQSGWHVFGSADLFIDHDQDDLDPDHIPIWWQVHAGSDGEFWRAQGAYAGWTANFDTRINTVSSVERQITALPAIRAGYEAGVLRASLKGGAGWYFLEIDDDVPKTRGYDRDDFRHSTLGYSAAADLAVELGSTWTISGRAQEWWDSNEWLQTEYEIAVRMDVGHGQRKHGGFVLSADFHDYNLDVYGRPDVAQPILPWNDDLMLRLSFETSLRD